ncbi:MAG: 50S ribosomal protein L9 [Alphaproteobacteria bacterium]
MAQTQIILLEKVDKLGKMGDLVTVKPGYARNYLIPQKKAMRASKENIAYFEAQRKFLEGENDKARQEAEKLAKTLDGVKAAIIRQASESGQLYGSVTSRDIADQVNEAVKNKIVDRSMVRLNDNFKSIGLFPVEVALHPEVIVTVTVNIARSIEEAETQAKTGRALIADNNRDEPKAKAAAPAAAADAAGEADDNLEAVLEESALIAEKDKQAKAAEKAAEDEIKAAKSAEKAAAKAAKKAAEAAAEAEDGEGVTTIGGDAE